MLISGFRHFEITISIIAHRNCRTQLSNSTHIGNAWMMDVYEQNYSLPHLVAGPMIYIDVRCSMYTLHICPLSFFNLHEVEIEPQDPSYIHWHVTDMDCFKRLHLSNFLKVLLPKVLEIPIKLLFKYATAIQYIGELFQTIK